MDKVDMTGTKAQLYNGIMLLFTFFIARLVYGTYSSLCVFRDVWAGMNAHPSASKLAATPTMAFSTQDSTVPFWLGALYLAANLTLNGLNFYWFFMMVRAVRKRFEPAAPATPTKMIEEPPLTEAQIDISPVASGLFKASAGRRRKA